MAILLKGWQSIDFLIFIAITLLLIIVHHYLSLRIKFDAQLIEMIAQESAKQPLEELTQQFDQTLFNLKLMPQSKMGRNWSLRFAGCFRLFKLQIALLFIQYFVLISLIYKLLAA